MAKNGQLVTGDVNSLKHFQNKEWEFDLVLMSDGFKLHQISKFHPSNSDLVLSYVEHQELQMVLAMP